MFEIFIFILVAVILVVGAVGAVIAIVTAVWDEVERTFFIPPRHEKQQRLQQQHLKARQEARERARVAFPELLDESEADGVNPDIPAHDLTDADRLLISEASEIVRREIYTRSPSSALSADGRLSELYDDLGALKAAQEDEPEYEEASLHLDTPTRVIDCGDAGRINLYTAAQVQSAQEKSGVVEYFHFLKCRVQARELARHITERAKLLEQKQREAEEAHLASITTKLDDLPPLPTNEN